MIEPGQLKAEGFTVEAQEVPHRGGRTFGYRVSDGQSVVTYIPDHCPTAAGAGPEGWGEYHPAALDLAAGSDLLIHDSFLLPEEVTAEASFGHAAADYAVGLGQRAGARRIMLAHHKPGRTDTELDLLAARLAPGRPGQPGQPAVVVAAEGGVLGLERASHAAVETDARWVARQASGQPTRSSSVPGRTDWRRR